MATAYSVPPTSRGRIRPQQPLQPSPPTDTRALLDALAAAEDGARTPTLMLHWAMTAMRAQWAAMYQISEKGMLKRVAKSTNAAKGGHTIFDYLGDSADTDMAMTLAARAMKMRTVIATSSRSKQQAELVSGSALATPLLDQDSMPVGCIVLLSVDPNREWPADEQQLVAYCAPMFTLHAQRARLQEQATWLAALNSEEDAHAQRLVDRVGKVVTELKAAHEHTLEQKKAEEERRVEQIQRDHEKSLVEMRLELEAMKERARTATSRLDETAQALINEKDRELKKQADEYEKQLSRLRQDPLAAPLALPAPEPPAGSAPPALPAPPADAPASGDATAQKAATADTAAAVAAQQKRGQPSSASTSSSNEGSMTVEGAPRTLGSVGSVATKKRRTAPNVDVPRNSAAVPPPPPPNWERRELSDGKVLLFTEVFNAEDDKEEDDDDDEGFAFYVESTAFHRVVFDIDFSGSENLMIRGAQKPADDLSAQATPGPYERRLLARLVLKDKYEGWSLKYSMKWTIGQPNQRDLQAAQSAERAEVEAAVTAQAKLQQRLFAEAAPPASALDEMEKMRAALRADGSGGFVDLEFPPLPSSIEPAPYNGVWAEDSLGTRYGWKRPAGFLGKAKARVFAEGLVPSDVQQGALGNCWVMCSIAAIAEFKELVREIFVEKWSEGDGDENHGGGASDPDHMYALQLYKHGEKTTVVVDDYFPCRPGAGGKPAFSQAHGPELWVLLIEKAYAKLHGSYAALRSGMCYEGLMDLTGAPTLYRRFDDDDVPFADLKRYDESSYVICASTPGVDTLTEGGGGPKGDDEGGLVPGHAYSLISAREIELTGELAGHPWAQREESVRLVKMRNPWGSFEWGGTWSDNSEEMMWDNGRMRAVLDASDDDGEPEVAANDGAFWMTFEDFKKNFVSISVCFTHAPTTKRCAHPEPWHEDQEKRLKAAFSPADTSTPTAHPTLEAKESFVLKVPRGRGGSSDDKALCLVGLHQLDERTPGAPPNIDLGLAVRDRKTGALVDAVGSAVQRDALLELRLGEGEYEIVPTTSGVRPSPPLDDNGVAYQAAAKLLDSEKQSLTIAAEQALDLMCFELDADMDGALNKSDLSRPAAAKFAKAAGIKVGGNFLTLNGREYKALRPSVLREALHDAWKPEERRANFAALFASMGCDEKTLRRTDAASLPYTVSVHCERKGFSLDAQPLADADREAVLCDIVKAKSGAPMKLGNINVYTLHSSGGASFTAENTDGSRAAELTLDCSDSDNVRSDRGDLCVTTRVEPGAARMAMLLMPADREQAWAYSYKCSSRHIRSKAADRQKGRAAATERAGSAPPAPKPAVAAVPKAPAPVGTAKPASAAARPASASASVKPAGTPVAATRPATVKTSPVAKVTPNIGGSKSPPVATIKPQATAKPVVKPK